MKKLLLGLGAVVALVAGVAAISAYEAHVINVTAHIENALAVSTAAIDFGTVFPQEYITATPFTVSLSNSFMQQNRVDTVAYKIEQKPKCWNNSPSTPLYGLSKKVNDVWVCVDANYVIMPDLCRFLSKTSTDTGTTSEPSYFQNNECVPLTTSASGILSHAINVHNWTVDLKVPPIDGSVGQDWPISCADYTVPTDGITYGCDLWIEVTGISAL